MDFIYFIQNNFAMFSGFLVVIISLLYLVFKKAFPTQTELAKIVGISDSALKLLIQIFASTEYNHVTYNEKVLKEDKVILSDMVKIPEQKMKVAVKAMDKFLPKKDLNKISDLFVFGQHAYDLLKPFFKTKK